MFPKKILIKGTTDKIMSILKTFDQKREIGSITRKEVYEIVKRIVEKEFK